MVCTIAATTSATAVRVEAGERANIAMAIINITIHMITIIALVGIVVAIVNALVPVVVFIIVAIIIAVVVIIVVVIVVDVS